MLSLRLMNQPGLLACPARVPNPKREVPEGARVTPAWVCLMGLFVFPRRDARRRTRPAPRCPRAPRGPLSRPVSSMGRGIGSLMNTPVGDARRYRIIIRGECGKLLASLIDNVRVVPTHNGDTCVVALVRDDPEFWGLLEQLRDLALHVISLQDLDHDSGPAAALQVPVADRR